MEKEFKQLRKLGGYSNTTGAYLDPEAGIEVLDSITLLVDKTMVTRVKEYFDKVYLPKFDFKVTTGKVVYTCSGHSIAVTFKSSNETSAKYEIHRFTIAMNTTKRKYTCIGQQSDFSQSTTLRTMLGKIEKEVYAAAKSAKKSKKPNQNVDVEEIIRFHS